MVTLMQQIHRHAGELLHTVLSDTPIAVIQGARQVGKTTLARSIDDRPTRYLSLDEPAVRSAAREDPSTFVDQLRDGCLIIDEVQRAPDLVLALKSSVDRDRRPGRFVITGSANLLRLPAMEDSLAGRAESIDLFGLSQAELAGRRSSFVDRIFQRDQPLAASGVNTRRDYLDLACAGGYPEAVGRTEQGRRRAWFDNYIRRIVQRDAADISNLRLLSELPTLLRLLAARTATPVTTASIARDAGIAATTLPAYLDLLDTLYVTHRVPAWSNNRSKRVARSSKTAILDSGLAARLLNVEPAGLDAKVDPTPAGALIETFALSELRKIIPLSETQPELFHYRELDGAEIDVVLEHAGRVVAIEVKASASLGARSSRWMARLRDQLGDRFVRGVVLYTGQDVLILGDRLEAAPLSALWES